MMVAVIGIGSNSVRMLVAQVEGDHARRLWRDREGTRLFAGLNAEGRLQPEAMNTTIAAVYRRSLRRRLALALCRASKSASWS